MLTFSCIQNLKGFSPCIIYKEVDSGEERFTVSSVDYFLKCVSL